MAAKRLQQHLEFVLTHLGYEYEAGRLSALQLVHQVVADFPSELVIEHAQFIMMPLVLRLVNDESNKVMTASAKTLQSLVKRLDKGGLDTTIDFCLRWFEQQKPGLVRAAAQVIGLVAETKSKHIGNDKLKAIVTALHKVCIPPHHRLRSRGGHCGERLCVCPSHRAFACPTPSIRM